MKITGDFTLRIIGAGHRFIEVRFAHFALVCCLVGPKSDWFCEVVLASLGGYYSWQRLCSNIDNAKMQSRRAFGGSSSSSAQMGSVWELRRKSGRHSENLLLSCLRVHSHTTASAVDLADAEPHRKPILSYCYEYVTGVQWLTLTSTAVYTVRWDNDKIKAHKNSVELLHVHISHS